MDQYAVTNDKGVATFEDVLIGTGYTVEEVDTAIRYVVPKDQTAAIEWNKVTEKSFNNVLKKFRVTVTKSDVDNGTAQGDATLAGATYGIYKGDQLVDTYMTDKNTASSLQATMFAEMTGLSRRLSLPKAISSILLFTV